jgi:hypothetical protein
VNSGSGGLNSGFGGFSGGGSTSGGGGGGGIGGILGGIFRGGGGGGGTQGGGGFGGFIKGIGSLFNKSSYSGFHIGDLFGRGDKGGTPGIDDNTPGVDEGQGFSIGSLSKAPLANTPFGGIAGGIGIALAEHGLLGNQRGTFAGTLQGAAGGYLIAGPIGAAVGAGIGFGEQIAGVESPRNEAKRLVKSQYGITINTAMADQIVAISQQSYASHVSLAVRSPEVRQMLGLYAAGTGQSRNFPQGADTPHGGGLVESGGRLFQQTTSLYGNQYAYSSNLPVYGGTAGVGTFPSPGGGGGNISLSLNVDGDGISPFMQGQVITPSYVAQAQAAAWRGSQGRVDAALALSQPGSIAS